jgi:predicted acylesterase/phospholipase RssA
MNNKDSTKYVPKIHFILPGGGVRGAFQAGFLYKLFKNFKDSFTIARVDGTSVGSINGFAIMNNDLDKLRVTWHNITGVNDLFDNWSDNPLIGGLSSLYYGYYNSGLFSNSKITGIVKDTYDKNWENYSDTFKQKYSCAVVNLENGRTKYVYGDDPNIIKYITASASPWVISNPVEIEDEQYADGGLLETYPIKHVDKCDADITVIVGYDQEHFKYKSGDNRNLLTYLANLIDIARYNSINTQKLKELIDSQKVVAIANPMTLLFVDFDNEAIKDGFTSGEDFAETFYQTYIKKFNFAN